MSLLRDKEVSVSSADNSFDTNSLIPAGQGTGKKNRFGDRQTPELYTPSSKSSMGTVKVSIKVVDEIAFILNIKEEKNFPLILSLWYTQMYVFNFYADFRLSNFDTSEKSFLKVDFYGTSHVILSWIQIFTYIVTCRVSVRCPTWPYPLKTRRTSSGRPYSVLRVRPRRETASTSTAWMTATPSHIYSTKTGRV